MCWCFVVLGVWVLVWGWVLRRFSDFGDMLFSCLTLGFGCFVLDFGFCGVLLVFGVW